MVSANNFKDNLSLSTSDILDVVKEKYINDSVEISFISKNINSRQLLNISNISVKGDFITIIFLEGPELHINTIEFDSVSYYTPGSLVFIFIDGSTLTLRPSKNMENLKSNRFI